MNNHSRWWRARFACTVLTLFFLLLIVAPSYGQDDTNSSSGAKWYEDDDYLEEKDTVADPLEPLNRVFFHFNDKLYFWVLKPASKGYSYFLAEDIRMCVRDFFNNLTAPIRIVNNLFQGKFKNSGIETARFVINSTVGIAGLADPAKNEFGLTVRDEDFGQTLAVYGVGGGIYICWPFFGPSNLRDTVGMIGDSFLNPLSYLTASEAAAGIGVQAGREVNNTSLTIGDYEDFKDASFDPYIALRDAYSQYRKNKIRDSSEGGSLYSMNIWTYYLAHRDDFHKIKVSADLRQTVEDPRKNLFHIQVGTYVDPIKTQKLCLQLASLNQETVVKVFDRGAYSFYGIQVPAGNSFEGAKSVEKFLAEAGFAEAHIVN